MSLVRTLGLSTIALTLLAPLGAQAQEAEISANAGWVSQYFYRGILQKTSSAPSLSVLGLPTLETAPRSMSTAVLEASWKG